MRVAVLGRCDHLILGGGVQAMVRALTLAESGSVLVLSQDTCLYEEMAQAGDMRLPRGLEKKWEALLFPEETRLEGGKLHPDRLKRYGERLFGERGIRLLYACQAVGAWEGIVLAAHKSGLYAIPCGDVTDCRPALTLKAPCYCLHMMTDGVHHVRNIPTPFPGSAPEDQFLRYEEALKRLPKGSAPARGGTAASELAGLDLKGEARRGEERRPSRLSYPAGSFRPYFDNPLYRGEESLELPDLGPETAAWDAAVAGGGTAGAAAAIYCARLGMRTVLLEMNDALGGTATVGGVSTYWFGQRGGATAQIDRAVNGYYQRLGLSRKKCLWCEDDVFLPDLKAQALLKLCLESGVEVRLGCICCGVEKGAEEGRVTGVLYAQGGSLRLARAKMVLDCTGDGDLCMFAGAAHTYGNEKDGMTYWASLAQFPSPDGYRNNFSTMAHVGDPMDYTRFIQAGRLRGENMYDHGRYVAVRESRHIKGMDTVTLEKIVSMEKVPDPLYICFSNYDPKGRLTADMAYFGFLPPNQKIPIPRGAVIPVDQGGTPIGGLLVGGKAVSCAHDAFPGVRMQPDLQRQGLALAALTSCALRQNAPAWRAEGVRAEILRAGGDLEEVPAALPEGLERTVSCLKENEPWEWLDAAPDGCAQEAPPIARIMTAESLQVLPLLRAAFQKASSPGLQLTLARLLLWHGDESGAQVVMNAVLEMLSGTAGLPRRKASVNYGQLLPDHGLMPEAVYLLNSLGNAPHTEVYGLFSQVMDRLEEGPRDWADLRAGIYCYVESFAYAAEKRGDRGMLPLIHRALRLPELNREAEDELMRERFHMLRITLLGALKRLGDEKGGEGLAAYSADPRRALRQAAWMLNQ